MTCLDWCTSLDPHLQQISLPLTLVSNTFQITSATAGEASCDWLFQEESTQKNNLTRRGDTSSVQTAHYIKESNHYSQIFQSNQQDGTVNPATSLVQSTMTKWSAQIDTVQRTSRAEIKLEGKWGYSIHWCSFKQRTNAYLVICKLAFCHRLVIMGSAGINSSFGASLWKVLYPQYYPSSTLIMGSDRSVADSRHLFVNKWVMQPGLSSPEPGLKT